MVTHVVGAMVRLGVSFGRARVIFGFNDLADFFMGYLIDNRSNYDNSLGGYSLIYYWILIQHDK